MMINKMLNILNNICKDIDGFYSLCPDIYQYIKDIEVKGIDKNNLRLQNEFLDNDYLIYISLYIQYNEDVDDFRINFIARKYLRESSSRNDICGEKTVCCKYNELNTVIPQTIKSCFNFINPNN